MPNVATFCTSFKRELLLGLHALGTSVVRASTAKDVLRAAAYLTSGNLDANTTAYTITGEATGAGYTAGGVTVANATEPATFGSTAFWTPSGAIVLTGVTIGPVDAILLYNSTQGNRAIGVFGFTPTTVAAGTLTLTMPVNSDVQALVQLR